MVTASVILALLASVNTVNTQNAGGNTPIEVVGPGSRADSLAAFAVEALKGQANDITLAELQFDKVKHAEQQVVAGINYRITAAMQPHGVMALTVFEQSWTNTLEISSATLTPSDVSFAAVNLVPDAHVALDSKAFEQFHAARLAAAQPAAAETADKAATPPQEKLGVVGWLKSKLRRRARA